MLSRVHHRASLHQPRGQGYPDGRFYCRSIRVRDPEGQFYSRSVRVRDPDGWFEFRSPPTTTMWICDCGLLADDSMIFTTRHLLTGTCTSRPSPDLPTFCLRIAVSTWTIQEKHPVLRTPVYYGTSAFPSRDRVRRVLVGLSPCTRVRACPNSRVLIMVRPRSSLVRLKGPARFRRMCFV